MRNKIFQSGGLGDVMLLESFYPSSPKHIVWASRARPDVEPIFRLIYPDCQHSNQWEGIDERYVRHNHKILQEDCPGDCEDWGIFAKFPWIRAGKIKAKGSSCLRVELADVSRFSVPEPFVVIQADSPYNDPDLRRERQLTQEDWKVILDRLDREDRWGVVVDCDRADAPPQHKRLVNLVGKTSLAESIEILKRAVGYYGIDSCLSVLASQRFDRKNLLIKWQGFHVKAWAGAYYYSHRDLSFCKDHFVPKAPKPRVVQAQAGEKVQVLLLAPRLYQAQVHNKGTVIEVDGRTAQSWCKSNTAVCWQQRCEQMRVTISNLQDRIAARSADGL
jgi:hypothetical protein